MTPDVALNILTCVSALALAVNVGRSNIKRTTIADLMASNTALKERVDVLEAESDLKDERILQLEETIDGYTELVRQGALARLDGTGSGNRPAHPKTTKNRGS